MELTHHSEQVNDETRYEALRRASDVIASQADLNSILEDLARFLPAVVKIEFLGVVLHDAEHRVFRLYAFGGSMPPKVELGREFPVEGSSAAIILQDQKPIIVSDTEKETQFTDIVSQARPYGVRSTCALPLTSPRRRLGALVFGATYPKEYDAEDLKLMSTVAAHVAIAVENALNFEAARSYQQLLQRERDWLRLLLKVNNNVISHLELGDLFQAVSAALRECFHHEYTGLWLFDEDSTQLRCVGMDFPATGGSCKSCDRRTPHRRKWRKFAPAFPN